MFGAPTVTNHVNKSYKMATGGVVPPAGTIGEFPSAVMPQGAPVETPEPEEKPKPQPKSEVIAGADSMKFGSHR